MIAPGRARRPGAGHLTIDPPTEAELETCPFCEGREDRTPPETFALATGDQRDPDTPGWQVRVVPNLYPAIERQEVVIHTPRHARSLVELDDEELSRIAQVWEERAAAAHREGFAYLQVLVNEGRAAGASLGHSHSQIGWFREYPPAPAAERTRSDDCGACELLAGETAGTRTLGDGRDGIIALCHPAGRLPYEMLIAPLKHEPEPWSGGLEPALDQLVQALRRLHDVEGPVPVNAWLHCAPFGGDGHWHLELVPRLTVIAGLELGAGYWINSLSPEEAAKRLRNLPRAG